MKLLGWNNLIIGAVLLAIGVSAEDAENDACSMCLELGAKVDARLRRTEAKADEMISIGGRLGSDGNVVPRKTVRYADSEQRYMDVFEGVCDNTAACNEFLHKYDADIENWFFAGRKADFSKDLCEAKIANCSAAAKASGGEAKQKGGRKASVEVHDEDAKKHTAGSAQKRSQSQSKTSAFSGEQAKVFLKKWMNEALRLIANGRSQFRNFYAVIFTNVKAGNWSKLGVLFRSAHFYRDHWFVLAVFGLVIAMSIHDLFSAGSSASANKKPKKKTSSQSAAKKAATADDDAAGTSAATASKMVSPSKRTSARSKAAN